MYETLTWSGGVKLIESPLPLPLLFFTELEQLFHLNDRMSSFAQPNLHDKKANKIERRRRKAKLQDAMSALFLVSFF